MGRFRDEPYPPRTTRRYLGSWTLPSGNSCDVYLTGENLACDSLAPRADVLANFDAELDALAEGFVTSRALPLVQSERGRVNATPRGEVDGLLRPLTLQQAIGEIPAPVLVAALVPKLRAALRRELERVPYLEGPPMADRPRLIAEEDALLARLHAEHREVVDTASALGLSVPDLAVNRAARAREERERKAVEDFNTLNQRAIARGAVPEATTIEQTR